MHKRKKLVKPHNTDLWQLFPFIHLINISLFQNPPLQLYKTWISKAFEDQTFQKRNS